MKRPLIIAIVTMFLLRWIGEIPGVLKIMQVPSAILASLFLGAPFVIDGSSVQILVHPLLEVTPHCSGMTLFSFLAGIGAGYWCGKNVLKWLWLLPITSFISLLGNAARISMAWQFRRLTEGHLPDWAQEYAHMSIGIICSLTITAAILYFIHFKSNTQIKEIAS
jgi:exosortase/archaeosortase family protein